MSEPKVPEREWRFYLDDSEKSYHAKFRVKIGSREAAKARRKEFSESGSDKNASQDSPFLRDFAASRETKIGDIQDDVSSLMKKSVP
ncbi:MAG: hypothetical protein HQL34_02195 [Alphaproteobacteria bacterium]|nr:hypothetical protein [Alphaproteobacteria bacterium]